MRKKLFAFVLSILFLLCSFALSDPLISHATENLPSRVINVVYDDSGSMINNGKLVDTWCQAKYSMEVFAAMLGNNDTMNVYVMSDYDGGAMSAPPRLTLKGSSGAETNVNQVHSMLTAAGNTPFNAVRKAYDDLTRMQGDEKWLVILTDGAFEDGAFTNQQVEEYLGQKAQDINVMFLSMGADGAVIKSDDSKNIFFEKAQTNDQILNKITQICTRIFNSNKLEVDVNSGEFSFDIPMSEFVVFAQGDNVNISGITDSGGNKISYDKTPVKVKYSDRPSSRGYADFIVDDKLNGSLATFSGDFSPGVYKVDAGSAKTVEVYYKPNVEIMMYLVGQEGQEVPYTDGVRAGDYTVKFGFVKAGTNEPVAESRLLGNIEYAASIDYNNGQQVQDCSNGSKVTIQEGKYHIDAAASYLKYNSVATHIDFDVFRDKELQVEQISAPEYTITKEGIENAGEPMVFKATLEGQEIPASEWANFELPTINVSSGIFKDNRIEFQVEKGDSPGVFNVYPKLKADKAEGSTFSSIDYRLIASHSANKSTWYGEADGNADFTDNRSWIDQHEDDIKKLIIGGVFLFILLGYTPLFKKRLPKRLKRRPEIEYVAKGGYRRKDYSKGKLVKRTATVMLPFIPERGTIKYLPPGIAGGPILQVKASGGQRMEITNTRAFEGRRDITFDGQYVEKGVRKNLLKTAGLVIVVNTAEAKCTCCCNK